MSVIRGYSDPTGHLTQLYTETKKSALSNIPKDDREDSTPALTSLHRKFRIQKDRLITWGLEWSDEGKGPDGNIDGSVARAGLTETVTSVLENIKEVLEQAERIKSASTPVRSPGYKWTNPAVEKSTWLSVDISKYRDLVTDLTTSVDILYDLSRNRRALAAGSHPSFTSESTKTSSDEKSGFFPTSSFASSEQTLVSQPGKSSLPRYLGLPPLIDQSALILPEEGPPPYQNAGVPLTTRMIGRLLRSQAPEEVRLALQESFDDPLVLVEYVHFDTIYQKTSVAPPMSRLEAISAYFQQAKVRPQPYLVGYFEDHQIPRFGLVFDLSELVSDNIPGTEQESEPVETYSLLHLLQTSSKSAKAQDSLSATPPLEDRFKLALRIAERVQDMHSLEVMHGSITSDSVTFVTGGDQVKQRSGKLRTPILDSFDIFARYRVEGQTIEPVHNLYRHPGDALEHYEQNSGVRYDMYGLGLVLLEIGLWAPLSDLYKSKYGLADFKERLERIWIPRLAVKCGSLYMAVVQSCFNFSDLNEDSMACARLHQTNLARLRRICLLCDDTSSADSSFSSRPVFPHMPRQRSPEAVSTPAASSQTSPTKRSRTARTSIQPHLYHSATAPDQWPSSRFPTDTIREHAGYGVDAIRGGFASAADGITAAAADLQSALVGRRSSITNPFREYRQRVMLIQNYWRDRRHRRSSEDQNDQIPADVEDGRHRASTFPVASSERHTIPRRPVPAAPKPRAFPVNLPPNQLAEWHSNLGLRVSQIVERALKNSLESSTIDLVGLGLDEASARPTILITCTSTAKVKAALKKRLQCDTNLFDVKVRKGAVALSRRTGKAAKDISRGESGRLGTGERVRRSHVSSYDGSDDENEPQNPYYHPRPICGASIGAYNEDEGHLLPVSFGGIVLVDNEPYGLTVHHMLEPPEDSDAEGPSDDDISNDADSGATSSAFESDLDDSDSPPELVHSSSDVHRSVIKRKPLRDSGVKRSSAQQRSRTLPITSRQRSPIPPTTHQTSSLDADDDSSSSDIDFSAAASSFSSDLDSDTESLPPTTYPPGPLASEGDTRGFLPTSPATSAWSITQPAMLDAQTTGWHPTDQDQEQTDEDHLLSFTLGPLFASSGLRRYRDATGLVHEIDWALFSIKPSRLQRINLVLGGRKHCGPTYAPKFTTQPELLQPVLRSPGDDFLGAAQHGASAAQSSSDDEGKSKGQAVGLSAAVKFPAAMDLFPTHVTPITSFPGAEVMCSGRTSGLATGKINAGMSFVKIYGRRTFSSSWTLVGGFGVGGDSGAWVVDGATGGVCGHVLAEKGGVTYFCPMEVLLADVRRVVGREVTLPGDEAVRSLEWREQGSAEQGLAAAVRGLDVEDDVEITSDDEDDLAGNVDSEAARRSSRMEEKEARKERKAFRGQVKAAMKDKKKEVKAAQSQIKEMNKQEHFVFTQ